MKNTHSDIVQVIHDYIADTETDWRIGERAIFSRGLDEEADISLDHAGGAIIGNSGAVRITAVANTRLAPVEAVMGETWSRAALLCLRCGDAAMANRTVLTELGNDMLAARPVDRLGHLFDLGLGVPEADCCIRTADPDLCEALRVRAGDSIADGDPLYNVIDAADADYVTVSRLGRIESFGLNQTPRNSLNLPAPDGYAACLAFVPPQQAVNAAFDEATYGAFRILYGIFADPVLVHLKADAMNGVRSGAAPGSVAAASDEQRAAVRVALRQIERLDGPSEALAQWRQAFEA